MGFYQVGWTISGRVQSHGPVSREQSRLPIAGSCCSRIQGTRVIVMRRSRQTGMSGARCDWIARRAFAGVLKDHSRSMAGMGPTSTSIGPASSLLTHTCLSGSLEDIRPRAMSTGFRAESNPSKELSAELVALAPANPFYTYSYIEARRLLGFEPWIFILHYDIGPVCACTAFMSSGYLGRSLEITSLPSVPQGNEFWDNLLQFCSRERVSCLEINSYASAQAIIPTIHGEIGRRTRCEYVLEL